MTILRRLACVIGLLLASASPAWATITVNHLTEGTSTSDNATTANISPTANALVIVSVGWAQDSTLSLETAITVSGCGLTWTNADANVNNWGGRRQVGFSHGFHATPSSDCALTINVAESATFQEMFWSVDEFVGADTGGTPAGTAAKQDTSGGTSNTVTVGDTPDGDDVVFAAFAVEGATVSATLNGELDTTLRNVGGGANVRTFVAAYDSAPDASPTPGITWTGSNDGGGIAILVNGTGGGGPPPSNAPRLLLLGVAP